MTSGTSIDHSLPSELNDEALQASAKAWRARALRGERAANGRAHELEVELRRRLIPIHPISSAASESNMIGQVGHITLVGTPGGAFKFGSHA